MWEERIFFKDNIKTYFVFIGMGNIQKGDKEGTSRRS